jgi:hypothetical protein
MNTDLAAPAKDAVPSTDDIKRSDRITGGYLLFVCVRCTLQYIVLPFVLPLLGLNTSFSVVLSMIIDLIALAAITYNIKRLWPTSWRWRYIALCAVMVPILIVFLVGDIRYLMGL